MGKLSKEEVARYSGANWLIEYAKKNGLEAAEQELEMRGARNIPQICKAYELTDSKYSARLYKRAEKFRSEGARRSNKEKAD